MGRLPHAAFQAVAEVEGNFQEASEAVETAKTAEV